MLIPPGTTDARGEIELREASIISFRLTRRERTRLLVSSSLLDVCFVKREIRFRNTTAKSQPSILPIFPTGRLNGKKIHGEVSLARFYHVKKVTRKEPRAERPGSGRDLANTCASTK